MPSTKTRKKPGAHLGCAFYVDPRPHRSAKLTGSRIGIELNVKPTASALLGEPFFDDGRADTTPNVFQL
jgi:hypothetical protein